MQCLAMNLDVKLFKACNSVDIDREEIKHLLDCGAQFDRDIPSVGNVLSLVCSKGLIDVLKVLTAYENEHTNENGDLVEKRRKLMSGALQSGFEIAVAHGHAKCAAELLTFHSGIDVNKPRFIDGVTPLMTAASRGHEDVAQVLLNHGADVNMCERGENWTPLTFACRFGRVSSARLLLDHGSSPIHSSLNGMQPLHIAARHGHLPIVQVLLNSHSTSTRTRTWAKLVKLNVNACDSLKNTPLHHAALPSKSAYSAMYVHHYDGEGEGQSQAYGHGCGYGYGDVGAKMTAVLLDNGANPWLVNSSGFSVLRNACVSSLIGIARTILPTIRMRKFISSSMRRFELNSCLRVASSTTYEHYEAVDPHYAENTTELIYLLLQYGADPNATKGGMRQTLPAQYQYQYDFMDSSLPLPLVEQSKAGNVERVKLLLSHGANPSLVDTVDNGDDDGNEQRQRCALDVAKAALTTTTDVSSHRETYNLLLSYASDVWDSGNVPRLCDMCIFHFKRCRSEMTEDSEKWVVDQIPDAMVAEHFADWTGAERWIDAMKPKHSAKEYQELMDSLNS